MKKRTEYFREWRKKNRDHFNAYKREWARKDRKKKNALKPRCKTCGQVIKTSK